MLQLDFQKKYRIQNIKESIILNKTTTFQKNKTMFRWCFE